MPTTRKRAARPAGKRTSSRKTSASRSSGSSKKGPTRERSSVATVGEVMTPEPVTMIESETLLNAAKCMAERDIGDVIVLDDTSARVKGIATDRDLVIRAIAEGLDPAETTLAAICSSELTTVGPDDPVDKAVRLMRDGAIRRLPVVEDGQAVGFVSIGDLALKLDKRSALAEISSAPANN